MPSNPLSEYLSGRNPESISPEFIAYLAALSTVARVAPEVASSIVREFRDQRANLKLIASENYSSLATQLAMGNLLTDKYAEGYPGHRFYAGCDNVDEVEQLAINEAKALFGAEHAYVQPHSGADANLIAFWSILKTRVETPFLATKEDPNPVHLSRDEWDELRRLSGNQRLLSLDYYSGGHLTHGYRHNTSARMFDAHTYTVDRSTGLLDYDQIAAQAREVKPLILLAGYSAYPRLIDFRRMRQIADSVGAVLMVDMAHFAGLVAGRVMEGDYSPFPHAHVVTTTTHKTLRGPRGGIVFCTEEFREAVDGGCPMVMGGPLPHVIAAKAVALKEANSESFRRYARQIVANSKALAASLTSRGVPVVTGGTDNHLLLVDVRSYGLNGRQAEAALRECGITLNRNSLPFDPNGPWYTSGLRLGTPATTTLGMKEQEMGAIAGVVAEVLSHTSAHAISSGEKSGTMSKVKYDIAGDVAGKSRDAVQELLSRFVLYPELDLAFLEKHFSTH